MFCSQSNLQKLPLLLLLLRLLSPFAATEGVAVHGASAVVLSRKKQLCSGEKASTDAKNYLKSVLLPSALHWESTATLTVT